MKTDEPINGTVSQAIAQQTRRSQARLGIRVAVGLLLAGVLMMRPGVRSLLWSNLGWLQLCQPEAWSSSGQAAGAKALNLFQEAIVVDSSNSSAFLGAGIAMLAVHDHTRAVATWQEGGIEPRPLIRRGIGAASPDDALVYFRGAAGMHQRQPNEGKFLAGQICQRTLVCTDVLSLSNQRFCHDYFLQSRDNLILNSQFDYPISWGWNSTLQLADDATGSPPAGVDRDTGVPAPSLRLRGIPTRRNTGVFQRISLAPGSQVIYRGCFQVQSIPEPGVWLLYIEWYQDGKIEGNYETHVVGNMDWTCFERRFTLPHVSAPWVQFYPAIMMAGQGTVWVDDVKVRIAP